MKKIYPVLFLIVIAFLVIVVPVMAQTMTPPTVPTATSSPAQTTQAVETFGLDIILLLAITAFFKTQMKLKGYAVMGAAFAVGLLLFLEPNIAAISPSATPWVEGVYAFLKLWFGGMGTYDFFNPDPAVPAPAKA